MIKSEFRLRKNRHFQYIYKKGKSVNGKFLTLFFLKTKIFPYKIGFSVSKKIGKSVIRSLVKRRMTECFNLIQPNFAGKDNCIFVAKQGIENSSFMDIKSDMEIVLKKAGLLL